MLLLDDMRVVTGAIDGTVAVTDFRALGKVCAALSFTKVNVGLFFAVAWLTTGLLRDPKWATGYRRVMVVLVASTFPFFIIVSSLQLGPWVPRGRGRAMAESRRSRN